MTFLQKILLWFHMEDNAEAVTVECFRNRMKVFIFKFRVFCKAAYILYTLKNSNRGVCFLFNWSVFKMAKCFTQVLGSGVECWFCQPQQQVLCLLFTLWHGHHREEAVLPRGEGLREQPNFPHKGTAKSKDIAGVVLANCKTTKLKAYQNLVTLN